MTNACSHEKCHDGRCDWDKCIPQQEKTYTLEQPPVKRLRATMTFDAHNLDDLHDILRRAAMDVLDLDGGQREERDMVSGDGHLTVTVRNPEPYTVEDYNNQLMQWHYARRAVRHEERSRG